MVTSISNIREIRANFAEQCAEGLEEAARDVRAGKIDPHRVAIVLQIKADTEFDLIGMRVYGAEAAVFELVGILELAKLQVVDQTTPDGD